MDIMVVVDASVWISRLNPQDVNHIASVVWSQQFTSIEGILVAPSFFLVEVAGGISRLTGKPALAKEAIADLQGHYNTNIVALDTSLVETAIDLAANLRLRGGDSIYVALAYQLNIPLVSWDKEQLQRGGSLVVTYTPDQYPFQEETSEEEKNNDHS